MPWFIDVEDPPNTRRNISDLLQTYCYDDIVEIEECKSTRTVFAFWTRVGEEETEVKTFDTREEAQAWLKRNRP